jgi:membrane-associated PAP2 superfamily phosphatase
MKLPISGSEYMFWTGLVYLVVGMYDIFVNRFIEPEWLQMCWVLVLLIPVLLPINKLVRGAPFWRT